ncbi:MAG: 4-(cytidine 5'-diphospho)-2-C-methyl-D-erythritol kinase [Variibacter sp.]
MASSAPLVEFAPAKINLTLRVIGRRGDGYHELESLVAFADTGDRLTLDVSEHLALSVRGPTAQASGDIDDNLVLKAARAFVARFDGARAGHFILNKTLPVAAGIGGGSSDAAAALRLLARLNGVASDDARLFAIAASLGADVPVCLVPRARLMRGIGERLSAPIAGAALPAILVNPRLAVPTKDVFARLAEMRQGTPAATPAEIEASSVEAMIADGVNDLEAPAVSLQPIIADVLGALRALPGCRLARMSGSGATCFALFPSLRAAQSAAKTLRTQHPGWWVRDCMLNRS